MTSQKIIQKAKQLLTKTYPITFNIMPEKCIACGDEMVIVDVLTHKASNPMDEDQFAQELVCSDSECENSEEGL